MSRPPALARSDSPDSEMEDEGAPDDFGDLLAEIGVIRTMYSRPELTAVSSDSLTDLLEVENQTDGVRKVRAPGLRISDSPHHSLGPNQLIPICCLLLLFIIVLR